MPLPIIRKIGDLHRRIVVRTPSKAISNNITAGSDIRNLFDGDNTTVCEIESGFGGSNQGGYDRFITFDFGKPRILDRIVFTQPTLNATFDFDFNFDYWIPGADIFISPTFTEFHGSFDHATVGENTINTTNNSIDQGTGYTGTPVSDHEIRYLRIRLQDNGLGGGWFKDYTQNFKFTGLDIYEQFDARDFSVEFNDSVLDMQGWTGPRYSGCKTIGKKINEYNSLITTQNSIGTSTIGTSFIVGQYPEIIDWGGDTTYGLNPNLENKTTAIYISNTIIGGRADAQFANIAHHSYINIEKILIVDLDDDSVRILDRGTEPFEAFHRFITTDFPTGGKFSMKLIDESTQANLKDSYYVKMNKGWLLRSFSYDAGHGPLPGVDENGINLNVQNYAVENSTVKDAIANPLSLYDAVSGSVQRATTQVWGVTDVAKTTIPFDPVAGGYADASTLGCSSNCGWDGTGAIGLYGLWEAQALNGNYYGNYDEKETST